MALTEAQAKAKRMYWQRRAGRVLADAARSGDPTRIKYAKAYAKSYVNKSMTIKAG